MVVGPDGWDPAWEEPEPPRNGASRGVSGMPAGSDGMVKQPANWDEFWNTTCAANAAAASKAAGSAGYASSTLLLTQLPYVLRRKILAFFSTPCQQAVSARNAPKYYVFNLFCFRMPRNPRSGRVLVDGLPADGAPLLCGACSAQCSVQFECAGCLEIYGERAAVCGKDCALQACIACSDAKLAGQKPSPTDFTRV